MKKYFIYVCLFVFVFFLSISNVSAREINLYFFHGDGCPHCADEEEFLEKYDDPNLKVVRYEVWYNEENSSFLNEISKSMEFDIQGVPVTIIGNTVISGFSDSIGRKIDRAIKYYEDDSNNYKDAVSEIQAGTYVKEIGEEIPEDEEEGSFENEEEKLDDELTITIPIFGEVNLKKVSLTSGAVIIGLVDGFNPCAMWVLLFLISILLGMKDRRKMWAIGLSFLFTSAFVYFLILISWLNIVAKISTIIWIRNIIALIALGGGIYNIYKFFTSKDSGCDVVDDKKRKTIFGKIKKFCKEKNIILAIGGACLLAISVNVVELACSAGLPLIFGQLLAINGIGGIQGVYYTLLYVLFFMIDDIIIFAIAMFTTKIAAISTKYNKYSHLIGGLIMFIIGLLLLFKPGILMFNFK